MNSRYPSTGNSVATRYQLLNETQLIITPSKRKTFTLSRPNARVLVDLYRELLAVNSEWPFIGKGTPVLYAEKERDLMMRLAKSYGESREALIDSVTFTRRVAGLEFDGKIEPLKLGGPKTTVNGEEAKVIVNLYRELIAIDTKPTSFNIGKQEINIILRLASLYGETRQQLIDSVKNLRSNQIPTLQQQRVYLYPSQRN